MLGSFDAAGAGDLRLLVDGESFGEPRRRIEIRKQRRRAAEDVLPERPDAARAIEMEDVRQLVGDDHLPPVVGVAQRRFGDRRIGEDDDAVRRKGRRGAVRGVDVVGDDDVDLAARRMELLRELRVRALGVGGDAAREAFGVRIEVDVEVRRRDRAPVDATGFDLRASSDASRNADVIEAAVRRTCAGSTPPA